MLQPYDIARRPSVLRFRWCRARPCPESSFPVPSSLRSAAQARLRQPAGFDPGRPHITTQSNQTPFAPTQLTHTSAALLSPPQTPSFLRLTSQTSHFTLSKEKKSILAVASLTGHDEGMRAAPLTVTLLLSLSDSLLSRIMRSHVFCLLTRNPSVSTVYQERKRQSSAPHLHSSQRCHCYCAAEKGELCLPF